MTPRTPRAVANTNKRRGAMVEKVVADYLAFHTGLAVERRRLEGMMDRGDLAGIPNVVVEIKSGQPHITEWLRETERERRNANADVGVLWWAPPGLAKTPARHVVICGEHAVGALRQNGDRGWAPLDVPVGLIARHASHIHPAALINGYWLAQYDVFATSGAYAAVNWNWTTFA